MNPYVGDGLVTVMLLILPRTPTESGPRTPVETDVGSGGVDPVSNGTKNPESKADESDVLTEKLNPIGVLIKVEADSTTCEDKVVIGASDSTAPVMGGTI